MQIRRSLVVLIILNARTQKTSQGLASTVRAKKILQYRHALCLSLPLGSIKEPGS